MVKTIPVIHRDHTFEYRGRRYRVGKGSDPRTRDWDGYSIVALLSERPGDEATVEEALHTMAAVRGYLARPVHEGWPYLPNVDGANPFDPNQEWLTAPVENDPDKRDIR